MPEEVLPEGYKTIAGMSPAEDHMGPFYYARSAGGIVTGFRAGPENCNGIGSVHGGVLMSFADYTVTMLALSGVDEHCATVSFSSDFMGAARDGDWIDGRGKVTRRTGSLSFVSGELLSGDEVVLSFQAVLRRLKKASR